MKQNKLSPLAKVCLTYSAFASIMIVVSRNAVKCFDKPLYKWLWQN